jgi:flagellar biosynthetic protein FliQ
MTSESVIRLLREGLELVLVLSSGPLLAALISGLLVSFFQAATQLQENTLSFVPKLLSVTLVLAILGPWMLEHSVRFAKLMFDAIALIQ